MSIFFGVLMFLTALFLILLVLVQRGRGGGLSGALGGMGGQSAFGTKAGDLFTRITMFLATFWILKQGGSKQEALDHGATAYVLPSSERDRFEKPYNRYTQNLHPSWAAWR